MKETDETAQPAQQPPAQITKIHISHPDQPEQDMEIHISPSSEPGKDMEIHVSHPSKPDKNKTLHLSRQSVEPFMKPPIAARWAAIIGIIVIVVLYIALPEDLTIGPSWLLPLIEGLLVLSFISTRFIDSLKTHK